MKKKIARRIEKGEKGGNSLNDEEKEKKSITAVKYLQWDPLNWEAIKSFFCDRRANCRLYRMESFADY